MGVGKAGRSEDIVRDIKAEIRLDQLRQRDPEMAECIEEGRSGCYELNMDIALTPLHVGGELAVGLFGASAVTAGAHQSSEATKRAAMTVQQARQILSSPNGLASEASIINSAIQAAGRTHQTIQYLKYTAVAGGLAFLGKFVATESDDSYKIGDITIKPGQGPDGNDQYYRDGVQIGEDEAGRIIQGHIKSQKVINGFPAFDPSVLETSSTQGEPARAVEIPLEISPGVPMPQGWPKQEGEPAEEGDVDMEVDPKDLPENGGWAPHERGQPADPAERQRVQDQARDALKEYGKNKGGYTGDSG